MKQNLSLKEFIKSHFSVLYSAVRSARNTIKDEKLKKSSSLDRATHSSIVSVNHLIRKIYVTPKKNRFNVIVSKLNENLDNQEKGLLAHATNLANKEGYALRIISRNCLPNANVYNHLLEQRNIKRPRELSFYTDWSERVSLPIQSLEVTSGDIFFTTIKDIEEWNKNE